MNGLSFHRLNRGEAAIQHESHEVAGSKPTYTVLVVEDENLVRQDLANQLRVAGFATLEADSAEQARSTLLADKHVVDLALFDLRMPGRIDGWELIRWTRRYVPHIKLVVVSAHVDSHWDLPVDAAFAKPVRMQDLLHRIRILLPPTTRPDGEIVIRGKDS